MRATETLVTAVNKPKTLMGFQRKHFVLPIILGLLIVKLGQSWQAYVVAAVAVVTLALVARSVTRKDQHAIEIFLSALRDKAIYDPLRVTPFRTRFY